MKALILEDNSAFARSLKELLLKEGFEAELADTWAKAASLRAVKSFELLILDILLPDKKGFEILKILSGDKPASFQKIAVVSGLMDESSALKNIPESLKASCRFFKKPIDEKAFLAFIQETGAFHKEERLLDFLFEKGPPLKPLQAYLPPHKTFDSKELVFAVFLAHLKGFSGELTICANPPEENCIQFHKGHIIKAASSSKKSFFGALLAECGLALPEDIAAAFGEAPSKKLGERLVEKQLLSPYMLRFMLKEQIKIRLSEMMALPSFKIKIKEKPADSASIIDMDFDGIDLTEWLADSLQTELSGAFLKRFGQEAGNGQIQKIEPVNKALVRQRDFLSAYNSLFHSLPEGETAENALNRAENKDRFLRLLLFGLLTKSIYLKTGAAQPADEQWRERAMDSILAKSEEDLFALLDLPWGASSEEAKKSYKQLIPKIHPDGLAPQAPAGLKAKAEKSTHKIKTSYEILKDPKKRESYMKTVKEEGFQQAMAKYEEGLTHIKEEKYEKAIEALSQIADSPRAPSAAKLYILWAKIKSAGEDLINRQEEAAQIKKQIDSFPISLRACALFWRVKGLFLANNKQYEPAKACFEKSLMMKKDCIESKKQLILIKKKLKDKSKKRKGGAFDLLFKKIG